MRLEERKCQGVRACVCVCARVWVVVVVGVIYRDGLKKIERI